MTAATKVEMQAKQVRTTATPGPWRVITTADGASNVYGGAGGLEFVCTTGYGEGARSDALQIVRGLTALASPSCRDGAET